MEYSDRTLGTKALQSEAYNTMFYNFDKDPMPVPYYLLQACNTMCYIFSIVNTLFSISMWQILSKSSPLLQLMIQCTT